MLSMICRIALKHVFTFILIFMDLFSIIVYRIRSSDDVLRPVCIIVRLLKKPASVILIFLIRIVSF